MTISKYLMVNDCKTGAMVCFVVVTIPIFF